MDVCLRVSRLIGIWLTEWELMVMSPRWDAEQIGVWAPLSWLINLLFNSFTVRTNMDTLPGKHKGHLPQTDPPDIWPKIKRGGVPLGLLYMLWSDWMVGGLNFIWAEGLVWSLFCCSNCQLNARQTRVVIQVSSPFTKQLHNKTLMMFQVKDWCNCKNWM